MKQSKPASLAALCALAALTLMAAPALAQTPPGDSGASMVKPPEASGTMNPANPDHMPVKRPPKATHDRMTHTPPASAAEAK
jgi:Spy/CpxP family protein refolding chaperone